MSRTAMFLVVSIRRAQSFADKRFIRDASDVTARRCDTVVGIHVASRAGLRRAEFLYFLLPWPMARGPMAVL